MAEDAPDTRPHVVMALPRCRGHTIADNALHRARALSRHLRVSLVSDAFPDAPPPQLRCVRVSAARFAMLRRFAHVPNELSLARAVHAALQRLYREDPFGFVLCHGYTLTRFAGHPLRRRFATACGMFMHGHIFSRPRGTYDARLTAWYRWLAPVCYRETDLVLALSPAQKALAEAAGAPPERVIVSPNGIQPEDLGLAAQEVARFRARPREAGPIRLLYVGRLAVEKGVDVLLEAFARVVDDGPDLRLSIAGDGPQRRSLESLCARLGIARRVRFLGTVARASLGSVYLQADVLCVPSRDEPLGNVVLEGMVAGCLVVASRIGGIPSMVRDGIDGVLVDPASPEALAHALRAAAADPERMGEMAQVAREALHERFRWDAIGDDIRAALATRLGI
jgi:glycosyltransferase involved in cell wall biosynthesis